MMTRFHFLSSCRQLTCAEAARALPRQPKPTASSTSFQKDLKSRCWTNGPSGVILSGVLGAALLLSHPAEAKLEGVNRPDLLPDAPTTVIDVAGFLTPGEEDRLREEIDAIEAETGVKLRLLAQSYPETPGLAVRHFWGVDDDTIVFVADPTFGGILNFNVGSNIDLRVPRSFWSRLTGKFGNKFYWQEKGESTSIINAVYAIDTCLNEPPSRLQCSKIAESE